MPDAGLAELLRTAKSAVMGHLVRFTGSLDAAEDHFSEAVEAALRHWPEQGRPANPTGWLLTVAKRKAIDAHRKARAKTVGMEALAQLPSPEEDEEARLTLFFACCH